MVNRILLEIYDFHMSVFLSSAMSALLIFKKGILKITLNLMLATRKISWKNLGLPPLSFT